MDQVRRMIAEIQTYLGQMTATQRLLIGSLLAVAVLAVVLVGQFSARRPMAPVDAIAADQIQQSVQILRAAGIQAEQGVGNVMVPANEQRAAVAALQQAGMLTEDTSTMFETLVDKWDWRHSREQNQQQYLFALQNELGAVIGKFRGVRMASVIIDAPAPAGLGRASRAPTASATIWMSGGAAVPQDTVDAAASLVAGARSGLMLENVRVIDGSTGRARDVTDESRRMSGTYLEHAKSVEEDVEEKLQRLLSYIPGVLVAVSAQVDVTSVNQQTRSYLPKGEGSEALLKRETTQELSETNASSAAEPGIRSMQGADINEAGGGTGSELTQTDGDTEFATAIGERVTSVVDQRGMPTFLAASINVPEGYIDELLRREAAAAAGDEEGDEPTIPTADQIRTRFEQLRVDIERTVAPLLRLRVPSGASGVPETVDGDVQVAMTPSPLPSVAGGPAQAGFMTMLTGGSPGEPGSIGRLIETALVGTLALVALGMMVMMVRRSSKRIELPSAEELVGVPPQLEGNTDMVGEADESEAAMAGIEVDEEDLRHNKMLEQVQELVETEPEKSALLISRWLDVEE